MGMRSKDYDEYQMINRQKIASRTMIITFLLVFINGIVSNKYDWARPLTQALIILVLATGYFVTCAIFKNAYWRRKEKNPYVNMLLLALVGILNIVQFFSNLSFFGRAHPINDGKFGDGITSLVAGAYFLYISVIFLIKILLERRHNDDE